MPLSSHLRASLMLTAGATAFVFLFVTRLLNASMADPNFVRGDNPFEILSLLACVGAPLFSLVAAMGFAFRFGWARKAARTALVLFALAACGLLAMLIISGAEESSQTSALFSAESWTAAACVAGATGIFLLLRWAPQKSK
ncbi:MAG: hypothetical protein K2X03_00685 [Bryobacteraceae bacterium]|nr:hypothetical protein [Bryobacteraceae bacterium]